MTPHFAVAVAGTRIAGIDWLVIALVVSAVVMVVVSHLTAEPDYRRIQSLTFETTTAEDCARTRAGWRWKEVAASSMVHVCILGSYPYFRG